MKIIRVLKGDLSRSYGDFVADIVADGYNPDNTGARRFNEDNAVLVLNNRGTRARMLQRGGGVVTRGWTGRKLTLADLRGLAADGMTFTATAQRDGEYLRLTGGRLPETTTTTTTTTAADTTARAPVANARVTPRASTARTSVVTTTNGRRHALKGRDGKFIARTATSSS